MNGNEAINKLNRLDQLLALFKPEKHDALQRKIEKAIGSIRFAAVDSEDALIDEIKDAMQVYQEGQETMLSCTMF
jgi:hypothetical protein